MNDKPVIFVGLVVGLAALTFPFWYTRAAGPPGPPPQLELPSGQSTCVESAAYMRAHHMELLDQWRNAVVREGRSTYVSEASGKSYPISLTKTCMGCHTNRETFCYRCHEYANVSSLHLLSPCPGDRGPQRGIGCWDCHHVESKGS
jgi:hypothetical protein